MLAVVLALPGLALALRGGPDRAAILLATAAVTAGLLLVDDFLRALGQPPLAAITTLLILYGTPLLWYEVAEPGRSAASFLAGAMVARAWVARGGRGRAVMEGSAIGLVLTAVALAAEAGRVRLTIHHPVLLDGLFSSSHGVLFWTPVFTVAVAALVVRAARGDRMAQAALVALGVLALASAVLRPWWAGGLGNARALPALPLLARGLAAALDGLREAARRRPLRVLAAAGAVMVAWNLLFMAQYRAEMVPRDDTVAFPAVAENAALLVAAAVGSPPAWPANWLFAARHRLPAGRYDRLGGRDLLAALPAEIDIGDLDSDQALLAEGWSVRHPCLGAICREVEGRARVLLPVVDPRAVELRVRALGTGTLRVSVDGATAAAALHPTFGEVVLPLPRALVHAGANEVVLEVSPGSQALVDALRLLPREGAR
ncbi:MAG: hypothetical protein DMF78_21790 [Acidobacteria bacterium]|nr:MAG: hypothetical protein DMF78_21790 [Acidobacteriota bacterium]